MLFDILIGLVVVGITVVIQGYGTHFWIESLDRYTDKRTAVQISAKTVRILIMTSTFLIFLHLIQSSLWAVLYLLLPGVEEFQTFEKAIYFSLVTFTTLGYGDISIASDNRILSGLEAINGIILIGWSTAFMFTIFQEIYKIARSVDEKEG
jgi:hypothetical protein